MGVRKLQYAVHAARQMPGIGVERRRGQHLLRHALPGHRAQEALEPAAPTLVGAAVVGEAAPCCMDHGTAAPVGRERGWRGPSLTAVRRPALPARRLGRDSTQAPPKMLFAPRAVPAAREAPQGSDPFPAPVGGAPP